MTLALCLHCGGTKFGALCPCGDCGGPSTGNAQLDILFSDHHMSADTIRQFGAVIRAMKDASPDPNVRFWSFISFVSNHPSNLLKADPPEPLAAAVREVLAKTPLPAVTYEHGRIKPGEDTGPPATTLDVPRRLYDEYRRAHPFELVATVDIKTRDGRELRSCGLLDTNGEGQVIIKGEVELAATDIVGIRPTPGCLTGWFRKAPWVEV